MEAVAECQCECKLHSLATWQAPRFSLQWQQLPIHSLSMQMCTSVVLLSLQFRGRPPHILPSPTYSPLNCTHDCRQKIGSVSFPVCLGQAHSFQIVLIFCCCCYSRSGVCRVFGEASSHVCSGEHL